METQTSNTTLKNYLLFRSGQLISLLGSSITSFVIIWWITLETGSPMYLALASLVGFAPMIILTPFAGVFVDRWNRKVLIGVVDLLQALATILLIFLFIWRIASIWYVLALLALRGVFQAFHEPAVSAIVPLMIPQGMLSRMNGINFLLSGVVNVLGPITAATLLEIWIIDQILWIDAATFIVAVIPLLLISIPSVRKKENEVQNRLSFREEFNEGTSFIKRSRGFLTFIMLATALNFLLTPLSTQIAYFVKFDHFGAASDLALVSASVQGGMIAGGLLMSLIAGFKRKMVAIILSVYIIFFGYAFIALTPTGQFWLMAMGGLILAVCLPIANVSIQTITQTVVPKKMFGRVNSVMGALSSAATPLGMILSGIIIEVTRTSTLFLTCSMSGIILLTMSWIFTDIKHVEKIENIEENSIIS
jgi:DHA3 family macrolide efflux protein-like MFS transporter